jgi:hypothetical protein
MTISAKLFKEIHIFESYNHEELMKNLEDNNISTIKKLIAQERNYLLFCDTIFKNNLNKLHTITNSKFSNEIISIHNWIKKELIICQKIILCENRELIDELVKLRKEHMKEIENHSNYIDRIEREQLHSSHEHKLKHDFLHGAHEEYILVKLGYFIKFILDLEESEEIKPRKDEKHKKVA